MVNVIAIRHWWSGLLDVRGKFSQPYPSNESLRVSAAQYFQEVYVCSEGMWTYGKDNVV